MKVIVQVPKDLEAGDLIVNDYGIQSDYKVFLSKVERVIDDGKAVVVGTGGHAHRVAFENILCQCVGSNAQNAKDAGAYITFKEDIAEALAKGGGAIRFETFTEWYDRTYRKDE